MPQEMEALDPLRALHDDSRTMLLLDRKHANIEEVATSNGLTIGTTWHLRASRPSELVFASLLRPANELASSSIFSSRLASRRSTYVRLLDRFFLPAPPDYIVSLAFFELIANEYDSLTSAVTNISIASELLRAALPDSGAARILDFGCGTGLALEAVRKLGVSDHSIELVGTDFSLAMRRLAATRGESVISPEDWRKTPAGSFDGAIAVFVLHYGVPWCDLAHIARVLRPSARFAANYFKTDIQTVCSLTNMMRRYGLRIREHKDLGSTAHSTNTMLVFEKEND